MNKYIFLLFLMGLSVATTANAQQHETIKKAIENPKAKEDAARADTKLIDNKKLTGADTPAVPQKQKKKCWFRKKAKTPSS
jgi:hypothetical protein